MVKLMDGGDLCMRTLAQAGVRDVFVLHGGHIDPILVAARPNGIRIVDFRHEAAAGHAADAYSRLTGTCAVAVGTAGPGFTNLLSAVTNCYLDAIPVLFLCSAEPLRLTGKNLLQGGFDQIAMAEPVTKFAHRVTHVDLIPQFIAQAMREAVNGRPGPVLLELPIDVVFDKAPDDGSVKVPAYNLERIGPAPTAAAVDKALDLLAKAERPVIVVGGGMLYSPDAQARLLRFAEATGIPVVTSSKARASFPGDHPQSGGALGTLSAVKRAGGGQPDVVLLFGARMGMFTGGGLIPRSAKIVQVDMDAAEFGKVRPIEVGIVADIGETWDAMLAAERDLPDWSGWAAAVHDAAGWHRTAYDAVIAKSPSIHPYDAARRVMDALPERTIVCFDGGHSAGWALTAFENKRDNKVVGHGYLGCLGIGLPFGIGAQVAFPDRPVVVISGDGALGFNLPEWDTMVRHDLPIVTVVLNNAFWGISLHGQAEHFGLNNTAAVALADTHYDKVAEGFGCHGERVTDAAQIGPAIDRAFASGRPACVNIVIDVNATAADFTGEARLPDERPEPNFDYRTEQVVPYYGRFRR